MASPTAAKALWCDDASKIPDFEGLRAVASDMDGTFLSPSHDAPAANLQAMRELESLDIPVLFSTGRNRASAQAKLQEIDLKARPGVFLNGAVVYGRGGSIIHERTVSRDAVVDVLRYAAGHPSRCCVVLCRGDEHFVPDVADKWALHLHADYDDPRPFGLGGWDAAVSSFSGDDEISGEPKTKRGRVAEPHLLHVICSPEELDKIRVPLERLCGDRVKVARSLPTCLTLLHPKCSKADGLVPALQEHGVSCSEALALGDAENDIEMLQAVRIGVAMGNAMPTVKQAAEWQCAPNSADPPGVAQVLKALASQRSRQAAQKS